MANDNNKYLQLTTQYQPCFELLTYKPLLCETGSGLQIITDQNISFGFSRFTENFVAKDWNFRAFFEFMEHELAREVMKFGFAWQILRHF